ncbi:YeeE/YedE family protein [Chondromyces crocatus]|uniref:Uncharacterized protein n=1 Tax=Chondromyces crocatus TaxID=52 RepID=A0A0K1E9H4_CHOCO|nr:YeeE/YedE family protein [Chondromyces crocatus]AKT37531.1 uncharacterized protein CMC5_016720 [Chondromyces crocatus]
MTPYLPSLLGGMLIGLSAALLLLLNGRIAGISGILGSLLRRKPDDTRTTHLAFLAGLLAGPWLYRLATGDFPRVRIDAPLATLAVAGLLVGFGARLGSGCTSGHGVAGLARLSRRSLVAVATFLSVGILTATLLSTLGA